MAGLWPSRQTALLQCLIWVRYCNKGRALICANNKVFCVSTICGLFRSTVPLLFRDLLKKKQWVTQLHCLTCSCIRGHPEHSFESFSYLDYLLFFLINITHLCFVAIFWPVTDPLRQGGPSKSCTLPRFCFPGAFRRASTQTVDVLKAPWLCGCIQEERLCTFCVSLASEFRQRLKQSLLSGCFGWAITQPATQTPTEEDDVWSRRDVPQCQSSCCTPCDTICLSVH